MIELDTSEMPVILKSPTVAQFTQFQTLKNSIYHCLQRFGPMTDNELYDYYRGSRHLEGTIRARRRELVIEQRISPVGQDWQGRTKWAAV